MAPKKSTVKVEFPLTLLYTHFKVLQNVLNSVGLNYSYCKQYSDARLHNYVSSCSVCEVIGDNPKKKNKKKTF